MDQSAKPTFTHERAGRLLSGAALLIGLTLALTISPWFLLAVGGTGLNLVLSGITDRCAVKSLLIKLGLPGERDIGRAEATSADAFQAPAAPVLTGGLPAPRRRFPAEELSRFTN